jgi:hypothetical protein
MPEFSAKWYAEQKAAAAFLYRISLFLSPMYNMNMTAIHTNGNPMLLPMNTKIFLAFVALNVVLALFFGFLPLVNFPFTLELNQIPYSDKLIVFGVVSGTAILFLAGVLILSFIWTRARKWEGAVIGILAGVYLFVVGILA